MHDTLMIHDDAQYNGIIIMWDESESQREPHRYYYDTLAAGSQGEQIRHSNDEHICIRANKQQLGSGWVGA